MIAYTMAEMAAQGKNPEILFWVGCLGSFDARAQKVTRALCEILNHAGVEFAILGNEERCTGDPARRAGNYDVVHHTQLINELISNGKLKLKEGGEFKGQRITYHDSCYLGRANDVYEAPRSLLEALDVDLVEMKRSRKNGLCCGAGGAQMWKEDEPGDKRINLERIEEALETNPTAVVANCPFCLVMLQDGLKAKEKNEQIPLYDLSEMILTRLI